MKWTQQQVLQKLNKQFTQYYQNNNTPYSITIDGTTSTLRLQTDTKAIRDGVKVQLESVRNYFSILEIVVFQLPKQREL